jgi:hypothetical protein
MLVEDQIHEDGRKHPVQGMYAILPEQVRCQKLHGTNALMSEIKPCALRLISTANMSSNKRTERDCQ